MNRRGFLRSILGTAAASAVAPSLVWPFRKIFLPTIYVPKFNDASLIAIELEQFAKQIPDLIYQETSIYEYVKKSNVFVTTHPPLRIPLNIDEYYAEAMPRIIADIGRDLKGSDRACAEAANKVLSVIDVDQENKIVTFGDFKRGYRG